MPRPLLALARPVAALVLLLAALTSAFPTASAAAPGERCFPETGFCVSGRFLTYWEVNGGLARNGYPLTPERREVLEDGREYTVQYFERVRMELHPENAAPYDVLLGQFGRTFFRESFRVDAYRYQAALAPVALQDGATFFPETGHNVGPRFIAYWRANGGLAQFGYPIAEELTEDLGVSNTPQSRPTTVQYFERARFEYHPENAGTPYEVLLGQFGRDVSAWATSVAAPLAPFYRAYPELRAQVGTPTLPFPVGNTDPQIYAGQTGALLPFERGLMVATGGRIQVLCGTSEGGTAVVGSRAVFGESDPWTSDRPIGGGPGPRPGTYVPKFGFGILWEQYRDCLGYAISADATPYSQTFQIFTRGWLISTPDGQAVYALFLESGGPNEFIRNPPEQGGNHYRLYTLAK